MNGIVIKAYKLSLLYLRFGEIFYYHYCVPALSLHIESTDSTIMRWNWYDMVNILT